MCAMLSYLNATRVAVLYEASSSKENNVCYIMQQEFDSKSCNITVSYKSSYKLGDNFDEILFNLQSLTRIVVVCAETLQSQLDFFARVISLGMANPDYLYVVADMSGPYHKAQCSDYSADYSSIAGALPYIFLMSMGRRLREPFVNLQYDPFNTTLNNFNTNFTNEIADKLRMAPYNCTDCPRHFKVGCYSYQLADTLLLYGNVLNRTVVTRRNGVYDLATARDGRLLMNMTNITFMSYRGDFTLDANGTRNPTFYLKGLTDKMEYANILRALKIQNDVHITNVFRNDSLIWRFRPNQQPVKSIPTCGFLGDACFIGFLRHYWIFIVAVGVPLLTLVLLACVVWLGIWHSKRKATKIAKYAWKIGLADLKEITVTNLDKSKETLLDFHSNSTVVVRDGNEEIEVRKNIFMLNGNTVLVEVLKPRITLKKEDEKEARNLYHLCHANVNTFMGLCPDPSDHICIAWIHCNRGSIQDVIRQENITIDAVFTQLFMLDIAKGLEYIHHSNVKYHGNLNSSCCLVDDRWQIKLSHFGMKNARRVVERHRKANLWVAPEILRNKDHIGSKEGDIYSFAIVSSELMNVSLAWGINHNSDSDIENVIHTVTAIPYNQIPYRPQIPYPLPQDLSPSLVALVQDCWQEEPSNRPRITSIVNRLTLSGRGRKINLMDHIFHILEKYATRLEEEVLERTKELIEEKKKADGLLYRLLPLQVAENLKTGHSLAPENYDSATVFFSDVVSFTALAAKSSPLQVVNMLNDLYTKFDSIIQHFDVYKMETIGDGLLVVSGLPHRNGIAHCSEIARMALKFQFGLEDFRVPHLRRERIRLRIGIHTGPCAAGVIGLSMPRYCVFGDTINKASRMESNGRPGHVHISGDTNKYLTELIGGFVTCLRGTIIVKGVGEMETYWLRGTVEDQNRLLPPHEVKDSSDEEY
ncbi:unnamed protein product [Bursaphelenchus okinawaensis]|uniref:Guanylate cyclase n=1 Tax=Bursaphelenchus okinawaensis TaxID=465554 RepID=A0A811KCB7_9BILA|nr:unnamed protein product [Bursaphelenchus okinawaensis]CAG9098708.1 unnamed protein product [Bursaphelenchus okinawaensis]